MPSGLKYDSLGAYKPTSSRRRFLPLQELIRSLQLIHLKANIDSRSKFWSPHSWSVSSSSRAPGGDTYPARPPETTLLFGPHSYPTGDREPRPEEEEDEELLPEPTDVGRPAGSSPCDPCDLTEDSSLASAQSKGNEVEYCTIK